MIYTKINISNSHDILGVSLKIAILDYMVWLIIGFLQL